MVVTDRDVWLGLRVLGDVIVWRLCLLIHWLLFDGVCVVDNHFLLRLAHIRGTASTHRLHFMHEFGYSVLIIQRKDRSASRLSLSTTWIGHISFNIPVQHYYDYKSADSTRQILTHPSPMLFEINCLGYEFLWSKRMNRSRRRFPYLLNLLNYSSKLLLNP